MGVGLMLAACVVVFLRFPADPPSLGYLTQISSERVFGNTVNRPMFCFRLITSIGLRFMHHAEATAVDLSAQAS